MEMASSDHTARHKYERLAPLYDYTDLAELLFKPQIRPRLLSNLDGLVLEAGIGTGCNLPFYPEGVRVVGLDTSPAMLLRAKACGDQLSKAVDLVAADICATGLRDRSFDAIIATFLFSVLDEEIQRSALEEFRRLCKPEGEIRILDYTQSKRPLHRAWMALWRPWQKVVYGGDFTRETERYISQAGLELCHKEFVFKDFIKLLVVRPRPSADL